MPLDKVKDAIPAPEAERCGKCLRSEGHSIFCPNNYDFANDPVLREAADEVQDALVRFTALARARLSKAN